MDTNNNIESIKKQIEEDNKQKQQVIQELTKGVDEFLKSNPAEACPYNNVVNELSTIKEEISKLLYYVNELKQDKPELKENTTILLIEFKIKAIEQMLNNSRGGKRSRKRVKRGKRKSRKNKI